MGLGKVRGLGKGNGTGESKGAREGKVRYLLYVYWEICICCIMFIGELCVCCIMFIPVQGFVPLILRNIYVSTACLETNLKSLEIPPEQCIYSRQYIQIGSHRLGRLGCNFLWTLMGGRVVLQAKKCDLKKINIIFNIFIHGQRWALQLDQDKTFF